MSDGFVTAGHCVEGLPVGRTIWEVLLFGFLAWFMLGAINESAPLAFSLVPTHAFINSADHGVMALSASLACGNFLAVLAGGFLADWYGRLAVIRPALLMTVCSGMLVQMCHTMPQAVIARFILGLSSGSLFGVLPPLVAELLPSRQRGFYLTIWCCGWPLGALSSILIGAFVPHFGVRVIYTLTLMPAMFLYVCTRADMLPESPRYLYLAGRRDEGYIQLMDMYEKQSLPLPWAPETIALHTTPARDAETHKLGMSSNMTVACCLALAVFSISAAAQSMKLWMPTLLVAQQVDFGDNGLMQTEQQMLNLFLNAEGSEGISLLSSFATGPKAVAFLSSIEAPVMLRKPNFIATMVLTQGYAIQFFGIIGAAFMAQWVSRAAMVQTSLVAATAFTLAALAVARSGHLLLCGPFVGLQLAAQVVGFNFLQAFAAEHFPTSCRARTSAFVIFMGQLGNFTMPVLAGLIVKSFGAAQGVVFFSFLYLFGFLLCYRLPLPVGRDQPLHDLEEVGPSKKSDDATRRKEWMSYGGAS